MQQWWFLTRSSGLVSLALAWLAVILGVTLAGRVSTSRRAPKWLLDLHRFAGALTLLFVGVHLAALVADSYVSFDVVDLFVPFASDWKPAAVAVGILAFWLLVAVELSSLWMRRLPRRTWRLIHLSSYVAAVAATIHLFTAGTDAANAAVVLTTIAVVGVAAFVTTYRVTADRRSARARAGASRTSTSAGVGADRAGSRPGPERPLQEVAS